MLPGSWMKAAPSVTPVTLVTLVTLLPTASISCVLMAVQTSGKFDLFKLQPSYPW